MARNKDYKAAQKKIQEAERTGATELDLSREYDAEDSDKLTELPESLAALTLVQTIPKVLVYLVEFLMPRIKRRMSQNDPPQPDTSPLLKSSLIPGPCIVLPESK